MSNSNIKSDKQNGDKIKKLNRSQEAVPISISEEEERTAISELERFYGNIKFKGNIKDKVKSIITKAKEGWYGASDTFPDRVCQLIGHKTLTKAISSGTTDSVTGNFIIDGNSYLFNNYIKKQYDNGLAKYLEKDERLFIIQRESEYKKEFDFNSSSDKVLLEQLLYIELLLRRIRIKQLTGSSDIKLSTLKEDKLLSEHRNILEKLGILRVQRIQLDQNIEGNVGIVALALDEKLEELRELEEKDKSKYINSLLRLRNKYDFLTREELEEILEERQLLKEAELYGELNHVSQSVFNVIKNKIESFDV